uniref:Uncharacterized protein n=1 Tax=Anguilla anguilla TaxID=7936 RepID=A0A0E9Y0V4_ANGAN
MSLIIDMYSIITFFWFVQQKGVLV